MQVFAAQTLSFNAQVDRFKSLESQNYELYVCISDDLCLLSMYGA